MCERNVSLFNELRKNVVFSEGLRGGSLREIRLFRKDRKNENLVIAQEVIANDTGSKTVVSRLTCLSPLANQGYKRGARPQFVIVMKRQEPKSTRLSSKQLRGLVHEKRMYEISNLLVNNKICPFLIRSYEVANVPGHVLLTESFTPGSYRSLRKFINGGPTQRDPRYARILLLQILWVIETFHRIGMRHNDLHLKNVLVVSCPETLRRMRYVTRDGTDMNVFFKSPFVCMFFDNDRVFKLRAPKLPGVQVRRNLRNAANTKAVTDLFPWHTPSIVTEKFDLWKILQHLREKSPEGALKEEIRNMCLYNRCVTLSGDAKKRVLNNRGYRKSNFMEYHLLTSANNRKEFEEPKWVDTSQAYLLYIIKRLGKPKFTRSNRFQWINFADMLNLYS